MCFLSLKNIFLTILRQCVGTLHHYCFLSPPQAGLILYSPQTVQLDLNFSGQRTGEGLCLERMGEGGNKGCGNWKRMKYYRLLIHIKTFTQMTRETCIILLLNAIVCSSQSVGRNLQCKWILWSIDSRPIMIKQCILGYPTSPP